MSSKIWAFERRRRSRRRGTTVFGDLLVANGLEDTIDRAGFNACQLRRQVAVHAVAKLPEGETSRPSPWVVPPIRAQMPADKAAFRAESSNQVVSHQLRTAVGIVVAVPLDEGNLVGDGQQMLRSHQLQMESRCCWRCGGTGSRRWALINESPVARAPCEAAGKDVDALLMGTLVRCRPEHDVRVGRPAVAMGQRKMSPSHRV